MLCAGNSHLYTERRIQRHGPERAHLSEMPQGKAYAVRGPVFPGEHIEAARAHIESAFHFHTDDVRTLLQHKVELGGIVALPVEQPISPGGELLGDVFCFGIPEEYRDVYRAVGYHLGRYIYTADAVDDYDDDKKRGSYNPCVLLYPGGMPEDVLKTGMFLELDALAKEVEKLPFGQFGAVKEILRNTVYLGLADRTHALFSPKPKKGKTRDERSL